jgi:hypothetical protein
MTPDQIQHFFDSTIKSQFLWRRKAGQLFQVGFRTLESAAEAKVAVEAFQKKGSKTLSQTENDSLNEFMLYEVGFFLIALSIENLLKAIWAGKNYDRIKDIKNIRKDLDGLADHDLARVASNATLTLSRNEMKVLDVLRDCILWFGRYPIPLRVGEYSDYMKKGPPTNYFMRDGNIVSLELPMPDEINSIFSRLIDELKAIPEDKKH